MGSRDESQLTKLHIAIVNELRIDSIHVVDCIHKTTILVQYKVIKILKLNYITKNNEGFGATAERHAPKILFLERHIHVELM